MDNLDERLITASQKGDLETVKRLLAEGADIHANNDQPLHDASERGDLPMVQFLVSRGANIHAMDDYALYLASEYGYLPIVKFLVAHGANIHANDDDAFRGASWKGHLPIVEFLLEHGADIHADNDYALRAGTPEVKRYLQNVLRLREIEQRTRQSYSRFLTQFQAEPPRGRFPGGREYRRGREVAISRGMRDLLHDINSLTLQSPWGQIENIGRALNITLPEDKGEAIKYLRAYVSQY